VGNKIFTEWQKAGIELAFFATGFICGYPPCPHVDYMRDLAEKAYGLKVIMGTHPIDSNFWVSHNTTAQDFEVPLFSSFRGICKRHSFALDDI